MKRSPLKRKTELKRKPFPRAGRLPFASWDEPMPTSDQVRRHNEELARRRKLKAELLAECQEDGSGRKLCSKCHKPSDFRGLQLIHKIALSQGGKTTRENCFIGCAKCHFGYGPGGHRIEGKKSDKPLTTG